MIIIHLPIDPSSFGFCTTHFSGLCMYILLIYHSFAVHTHTPPALFPHRCLSPLSLSLSTSFSIQKSLCTRCKL